MRRLSVLWLVLAGCSAARALKPLPAGGFAAEVSAPGVWTANADVAFPIATIVLGGRYGLGEGRELRLNFHPTELVVGVLHLEVGAAVWRRPGDGWVPALQLSTDLSFMVAPGHLDRGLDDALRGALDLSATAHWEPFTRLWPYVVLENALVLAGGQYTASIYAGAQGWITPSFGLSIETGWAALNTRTRSYSQPYLGVGGRGALWLAWALTYQWGGE